MKKRHKALLVLLFIVVGLPFLLWLSWLLTTPRPIAVFIMDKTSYSVARAQNRALNWVLTHYRFVKPDGRLYNALTDYYGFYPVDDHRYELNDLSQLNQRELQRLAIQYHMAYFADSYGVYTDMWPEEVPGMMPAQKLYGGLVWQDLYFLQEMIDRDRLVIAEFIFMSPPTTPAHRLQAEGLFGMQWQGWTGKFFHTFNPEEEKSVPPWVPVLYQQQYQQPWNPEGEGIILVHEDETLVVLQYPTHLNFNRPRIITGREDRRRFGVSNKIAYPGWFDITFPTGANKKVVSWFELDLTPQGRALCEQYGLPERFPAVISQDDLNRMYYFAGDFGFSPLRKRFVKVKASRYFELFLADLNDPTDKNAFFFAYYLPMMRRILGEYQADLLRD